MSFAEKLTSLRIQRQMSQEELADKLCVSRQTIGKWENSQASPELSGLIALSSYFNISIDALVKEGTCTAVPQPEIADIDLRAFLLRAKKNTYAAHAPEATSLRPDAHEFVYSEPAFIYRDSYFGGMTFHGEETVYAGPRVIWCMNYSGRTLSDDFSGDFLKLALHQGTLEKPYRGPDFFQQDVYTYLCESHGSLEWFSGDEKIYFDHRCVYECRFHGGYVK